MQPPYKDGALNIAIRIIALRLPFRPYKLSFTLRDMQDLRRVIRSDYLDVVQMKEDLVNRLFKVAKGPERLNSTNTCEQIIQFFMNDTGPFMGENSFLRAGIEQKKLIEHLYNLFKDRLPPKPKVYDPSTDPDTRRELVHKLGEYIFKELDRVCRQELKVSAQEFGVNVEECQCLVRDVLGYNEVEIYGTPTNGLGAYREQLKPLILEAAEKYNDRAWFNNKQWQMRMDRFIQNLQESLERLQSESKRRSSHLR